MQPDHEAEPVHDQLDTLLGVPDSFTAPEEPSVVEVQDAAEGEHDDQPDDDGDHDEDDASTR